MWSQGCLLEALVYNRHYQLAKKDPQYKDTPCLLVLVLSVLEVFMDKADGRDWSAEAVLPIIHEQIDTSMRQGKVL